MLLWSQLFRYRLRRSPVQKQEESESPPKQLTSRYQVHTSTRRSPATPQLSRPDPWSRSNHCSLARDGAHTRPANRRNRLGWFALGCVAVALARAVDHPAVVRACVPAQPVLALQYAADRRVLALPGAPARGARPSPILLPKTPLQCSKSHVWPPNTLASRGASHRCIGINRGARRTHDTHHAPAHICCRPGHVRRRAGQVCPHRVFDQARPDDAPPAPSRPPFDPGDRRLRRPLVPHPNDPQLAP